MDHAASRFRLLFWGLFAALLIAGSMFMLGLVPLPRGHNSARPPCEQLPDYRSVSAALTMHDELVDRIESAGPGVKVEIAAPCEGQPRRAILRIWYRTETEWNSVDAILRQEGFGVDVEVVRR